MNQIKKETNKLPELIVFQDPKFVGAKEKEKKQRNSERNSERKIIKHA